MKSSELTLRDKVVLLNDMGIDRLYCRLLLAQQSMTAADRVYVEKLYDIVKDCNRR